MNTISGTETNLSPWAIEINQLVKNYPKVAAVKNINLNIAPGEFFGLLGPNGAGKSTLIHCMVGLCKITSGDIKILGKSVQRDYLFTKSQIGFAPQEANIDRFFNLQKTLEFQGGFYGMSHQAAKARANELLALFDLTHKAKEQFYKLSGGMQRRVLIARALVSNPKVLILDEPTAGVDVQLRYELWALLKKLNASGTTILLTTHYIDEAESLCQRIGIINHGQIMELGAPQVLINKYCENHLEIMFKEKVKPQLLVDMPNVVIEGNCIKATGERLGIITENILAKVLQDPEQRMLDINIKRGDLEEAFVKTIRGS